MANFETKSTVGIEYTSKGATVATRQLEAYNKQLAQTALAMTAFNNNATAFAKAFQSIQNNTVDAKQALAELNKAMGYTVRASQQAAGGITGLLNKLSDYGVVYLTYKGFNLLSKSFTEGVSHAADYIIKINEIRSINQKAGQSFDYVSQRITGISNAFGLEILDTAEGAYQTLSNQVANGGAAFDFLEKEAKFAVASVSKLSDAVDLTSAALKAYQLDITETERVNAILFKGIELGRFRASELNPVFGRLANTGRELGVSLEEVVGSLATFTIQGTKVTESATILNNVMLSLIKPSAEMKKFFNEQGFISPKAALDTLGFVNVLKLFNEELDRNPERIAKIAGNIRTLRGILAAGGKSFKDIKQNVDELSNSYDSYNKAFTINFNNAGREFKIFQTNWENGWRIVGESVVPLINSVGFLAKDLIQGRLNVQLEESARLAREVNAQFDNSSAIFQSAVSKNKKSVEELAQALGANLARQIRSGPGGELAHINAQMDKVKLAVKDRGAGFFEDLKQKISSTTEAATQAKAAIDKIRGTSTQRGLLQNEQAAQDKSNFERSLRQPFDNSLSRQVSTIRQEIDKLLPKQGLPAGIGKAFAGFKGDSIVKKTFGSVEEVTDTKTRLLELFTELNSREEKSIGKRAAYLKLNQDINSVYAFEKKALEDIAQKNEEIRAAKLLEASEQKANLKVMETSLQALARFDAGKFVKNPEAGQKALSLILNDLNKSGDLFKQDANFNTALTTRITLLKDQLKIQEQVKETQEKQNKSIEAGKQAGLAEVELARKKQINTRRSAFANADRLQEDLGKDQFRDSIKDQLFEAIKEFIQTQGQSGALKGIAIADTEIARRAEVFNRNGSEIEKAKINELTVLKQRFDTIRQLMLEVRSLNPSTSKPFDDLAKSVGSSATSFGQLDQTISPVIGKMANAEAIFYGFATAADAAARALAAFNKITSGRTDVNLDDTGSDDTVDESDNYWGQTFAFGGRGSDRIRALLSKGESVVNARSSAKFHSQIAAIQSGRNPTTFKDGGPASVTNVGDVNISVANGSDLNIRKIGQALHRDIRRGGLRKI